MEDFSIFVAPPLVIIATIVFLVIYMGKYKDPVD
ncbi:hypothetical protein J2T13_002824 [Paenibacillus sp. DS2015]